MAGGISIQKIDQYTRWKKLFYAAHKLKGAAFNKNDS